MFLFGNKYKKECEQLKAELNRMRESLALANENQKAKELEIEGLKTKIDQLQFDFKQALDAKELVIKNLEQEIAQIRTDSSTLVFFDLETTGVNKQSCEILEIGALKYRCGQIVDKFHTYVKPIGIIPSDVTAINGITSDTVADAPSLKEALNSFSDFINQSDILAGYNIAAFDIPILKRDLMAELNVNLNNKYIDVLKMVSVSGINTHDKKLSTVAEYFGISTDNVHHALDDCDITIQCYEALSEKANVETCSCYDVSTPKSARPVAEDPETEKKRFEVIKDECPDFSIEGKVICLTGTFSSGEKSEIEQMIIDRGGTVKTSVSKKIDFLIVGNIGSEKWKHGQYGTKIVQACNIIENGGKIQILKENVLADYLGSSEN